MLKKVRVARIAIDHVTVVTEEGFPPDLIVPQPPSRVRSAHRKRFATVLRTKTASLPTGSIARPAATIALDRQRDGDPAGD
jgi:hypothetical protein